MAWTTPRTWVAGETVTAALLNSHLRDNLNAIAAAGISGYTSWTPDINSSGTAPTFSSATGYYTQIGKFVHAVFDLTISTAGTGVYYLTTPVAVDSNMGSSAVAYDVPPVGRVFLRDSSTGANSTTADLQNAPSGVLMTLSGTAFVTATAPFIWASGDVLVGSYWYETSA